MRVIERTTRTINLSGIDDHTVRNLTIVTAGGVVRTHKGDVVLVIHQMADMTRDSKTILSCPQLEDFGCTVNEKPKKVTGKSPSITTIEGYKIPIAIKDGLPYIRMRPFRDKEWDSMPHVCVTSPKPWDPTKMDAEVKDKWYQKQDLELGSIMTSPFDHRGMLKEDPEDDGEENSDDQYNQAVDRGPVRAFFTSFIQDELSNGYIVCEADGKLYDIDYDSDKHDEYYGGTKNIKCFPARRSSRLATKETVKKSSKKGTSKDGRQIPNASHGQNPQEHHARNQDPTVGQIQYRLYRNEQEPPVIAPTMGGQTAAQRTKSGRIAITAPGL